MEKEETSSMSEQLQKPKSKKKKIAFQSERPKVSKKESQNESLKSQQTLKSSSQKTSPIKSPSHDSAIKPLQSNIISTINEDTLENLATLDVAL